MESQQVTQDECSVHVEDSPSTAHSNTPALVLAAVESCTQPVDRQQNFASAGHSSTESISNEAASAASASQESTPVASAIGLLQTQAQQAEQREAQRRKRQEVIVALQQNLALQHKAAGA